MAWLAKVAAAALLAMLTVVAGSACSSALGQTEEELAAGFTDRTPSRLSNVLLPDGGYGICQQINIIGNNCHDPNGFPVVCCIYIASPSPELQGPACWSYGPTLVEIQQVGKGYCCARFPPGLGPTDWVRWEDLTPCGFCGGKTPGQNECCTRNLDIVPKSPIVNLDDCPGRVQIKEPAHTVPACGPAQSGLKRAIIPQRFGPVPFEPSCIVHDKCYSTCRSDKYGCDLQIMGLLRAACMDAFAPQIEAMARAGADPRHLNSVLNGCLDAADAFFGAVVSMGQDAYDIAQKDFCKCCE